MNKNENGGKVDKMNNYRGKQKRINEMDENE